MTGTLTDLVLGTIVFTAVMLAFHQQRQRETVVPLVIDDELLHRMTQGMKRFEQTAQSVGEASLKAAKAFEKFGEAMSEFNDRQWAERTGRDIRA